jgi:hypothetical protein
MRGEVGVDITSGYVHGIDAGSRPQVDELVEVGLKSDINVAEDNVVEIYPTMYGLEYFPQQRKTWAARNSPKI